MISLEFTQDQDYIKSVFFNTEIFPFGCDDNSLARRDEMKAIDLLSIPGFFLKVMVDGVPAGVFWGTWHNRIVDAHVALLDNCRGKNAVEATKQFIKWVFSNTFAESVEAGVWSDTPAVSWLCRTIGMMESYTKPWPNTRNGQPVDITYFVINKGEQI